MTKVLVTGAAGNAGQAVCRALMRAGFSVRGADVTPPPPGQTDGEFFRCDTRTSADCRRAVEGVEAVIHLAAWHSAHRPPVSDDTIFAVNVGGTFNLLQACREFNIPSLVFASSMAYGWGGIYSVTKVMGEDLCRAYHEFIPRPYLEFGSRLLRNGVDRRDVAAATVAALLAAIQRRVTLFTTVVHTNHGMPEVVAEEFRLLGPDWCEQQVPGARDLLAKYAIALPERMEQHDLTEAERVLGWRPSVGFVDFLRDLQGRDARGEDVHDLRVPSELPTP